jgi:hypothetical protein
MDYIGVCTTCGSPWVEVAEWRTYNTGEHRGETNQSPHCPQCEDETDIEDFEVQCEAAAYTAAVDWCAAYHKWTARRFTS